MRAKHIKPRKTRTLTSCKHMSEKMRITIWDKEVEIDDKVLEVYKKNGNQMTDYHYRYLAKSMDADENAPAEELGRLITQAMQEDIDLQKKMPDIIDRIVKMG